MTNTIPNTKNIPAGSYTAMWCAYSLSITLADGSTVDLEDVMTNGIRGSMSCTVVVTVDSIVVTLS